jgi:hypothetical protein
MDLNLLRERIEDHERKLIALREGPYGYMRASVRYDREMPKIARIKDKIKKISDRRYFARQDEFWERSTRIALDKFRKGKRFLSLDLERTLEGVIEEIGVTVFRGNSIETYNYALETKKRTIPFEFGETIVVATEAQMKRLVLSHFNTADFLVGHSVHFDLDALRDSGYDLPRPYYYDTAQLCKARFGRKLKLVDLAHYYHVGATHFHCAGNDSRYTADVFLKMIHEGT